MRNNNNDDYFEATRRGSRVGTSNDSESLELLGEGSGSYGSAEPLERGTSNSSSEPYQSSEKLRPYVRKIIEFSVVAECLMAFYIPLWFSMMFEGRVQPHLVAAVVVAVFNLFGCFCEGIGKVLEEDAWLESAKIASLTSKYSTGLRGGFLTVITSFPDIAECGKDMVNWSKIIVIGIVYCWGVMIFGTYLYRQGRFYAKTRRKDLTKTLLAIGPSSTQLCIGVVLLSVIFAVWNPSFLKIGAAKRPQGQTGFTFGFWTPELKELIAGMIFSAGGALCSFYLSEVLTDKPVLGRFITNIVSIAMVVFVRFIYYLAPSTVQSVVLAKFSTSFCGAASSFSGTIGDVRTFISFID